MKPSKYNICLPYDDRFVIFNGITKRFFLVSSQNKEAFLQILSAPNEFKEQYAPFLQRMAKEGFIIEDDVDELEIIKQEYQAKNQSEIYQIMIMPTYSCNVSCWYCTQHHQNICLSHSDVEIIKKHISFYIEKHHLRGIHISWFGGEPLMGFKHIKAITSYTKEYCQKHKLEYKNTITTNGILISRDVLKIMRDHNFVFFQITIDGKKDDHDKTKFIKGESAYERVMRNICLITEILPKAEINLRYNFTKQNLRPQDIIHDMNSYLPENVRKHIMLSIMKVWQQDENEIEKEEINKLIDLAEDSGYRTSVGGGFDTCYVDNNHFNCVYPNGKVDKCDNSEMLACRGQIAENGDIIWNTSISFLEHTILSSNDNECIQCPFLPMCYGPCPKEREKMSQNHSLTCRFQDKESLWFDRIYFYCKTHMYHEHQK